MHLWRLRPQPHALPRFITFTDQTNNLSLILFIRLLLYIMTVPIGDFNIFLLNTFSILQTKLTVAKDFA